MQLTQKFSPSTTAKGEKQTSLQYYCGVILRGEILFSKRKLYALKVKEEYLREKVLSGCRATKVFVNPSQKCHQHRGAYNVLYVR